MKSIHSPILAKTVPRLNPKTLEMPAIYYNYLRLNYRRNDIEEWSGLMIW